MKMHPSLVLTISICTSLSAAVMAGCKKEAREPMPEITAGAEALPPEPKPAEIEELPCERRSRLHARAWFELEPGFDPSVGEEMATGTDEASWAQDRKVTPSRE